MAGHAGNYFTAAIGKQTAKGTPQSTPKFKLRVTGGVVMPEVQILDLPETDSSVQASRAVKVGGTVTGALEGFIRADEFSFLSYLHLGAVVTSGAGPYTHTITAATQLPYATIFNAFDSTALVERLDDCRIVELNASGGSGQALSYSASVLGLSALEGSTDPVLAASTFDPLTYPNVTVTLNSVTTDIVESFTISSKRTASVIQGDTGMAASDSVTGRWEVTGTLRVLFENDQLYRNWLTGSTSGTTHSASLVTVPLDITATRSSSDEVKFTMTAVELRKVSLVPDASGNPIFYDVEFRAQPQATIGNTLTIACKNSTATL